MGSIEVTVRDGALRGTTDDGVARFLGIPYAAPPVGDLRLREPPPPAPWDGVRDATLFGPTAPKGAYPEPVQPLLPEVDIDGDGWLNLNVWSPDSAFEPNARLLPVLVWIHGGSFLNGSGSVGGYDGSAFARSGVVTVTINYRLGAEGSLVADGVPDSLGLRDQVAALTWVRDNIASFGGDAGRVTVAGESAGAMSIAGLLAAPAAHGLFAAAVLQSMAINPVVPLAEGRAVTELLASRLGVEPTRDGFASIEARTLALAVSELARAARLPTWDGPPLSGIAFSPVVGDFVGSSAVEAVRSGVARDVPVLIGTTRDEAELFLRPMGLVDADLSHAMTESRFAAPARELAGALAARDAAPVWLYRFDGVDVSDNGGLGSCHASEIGFVFDTADLAEHAAILGPAPSRAVVELMHGTWVGFVTEHTAPWTPYGEGGVLAALSDRIDEQPA